MDIGPATEEHGASEEEALPVEGPKGPRQRAPGQILKTLKFQRTKRRRKFARESQKRNRRR